jgi:hypothetical protein
MTRQCKTDGLPKIQIKCAVIKIASAVNCLRLSTPNQSCLYSLAPFNFKLVCTASGRGRTRRRTALSPPQPIRQAAAFTPESGFLHFVWLPLTMHLVPELGQVILVPTHARTNLGLGESIACWGLCVASEPTHRSISDEAENTQHRRISQAQGEAFSHAIPRLSNSLGPRKCILSREEKLVSCMIGSHSVAWSGDGPPFG